MEEIGAVVGESGLKVVGILQKERALLRKVDLETLIDSDLRVVRLDLAEIGMQRRIDDERVAQHEFRIESGAVGDFRFLESRAGSRIEIDRAERSRHRIRRQLNVVARANSGDT